MNHQIDHIINNIYKHKNISNFKYAHKNIITVSKYGDGIKYVNTIQGRQMKWSILPLCIEEKEEQSVCQLFRELSVTWDVRIKRLDLSPQKTTNICTILTHFNSNNCEFCLDILGFHEKWMNWVIVSSFSTFHSGHIYIKAPLNVWNPWFNVAIAVFILGTRKIKLFIRTHNTETDRVSSFECENITKIIALHTLLLHSPWN